MSHVADIGQFVWARPGTSHPDSPFLQWWGTLLANALIALLALWRTDGFDSLAFLAVPLMFLLFFGALAGDEVGGRLPGARGSFQDLGDPSGG